MEIGGLLHERGGVKAVDKKLDNDPVANHNFLNQRSSLLKHKQANPASRITSGLNPLVKEKVEVHEERVTGLRGPKMAFMQLEVYERRFGPAPPDKIKTQIIGGVSYTGVDIVREEDCARVDFKGKR